MNIHSLLDWARVYQISAAVLALCGALGVALATVVIPPVVTAVTVFLAVECAIWSVAIRRGGGEREKLRRLNVVRGLRGPARARSIYDQETGFCAEWYFLLRLEEEIARCERSKEPFAILFVEPRLQLGQQVKTHLLKNLERTFRSADLVGHFGSFRFAVMLIEVDPNGARIAGERLESLLGSGNVQVSTAVFPQDGRDWRGLLATAGITWTAHFPDSEPIWMQDRRSSFDR